MLLFPILGGTFVIGAIVGIGLRLATGQIGDATNLLALIGFGLLIAGGSIVLSWRGATQAGRDEAFLHDWLGLVLDGPVEDGPARN